MRTVIGVLLVLNLVAWILIQTGGFAATAPVGSVMPSVESFALVSELPPVEPVCYRVGLWEGVGVQKALLRWLDALHVSATEHSRTGDVPTIEVWVESTLTHSDEVKARLEQALVAPIRAVSEAKRMRFLVGRFTDSASAQALQKRLRLRLFNVTLLRPSVARASGFYEFLWPADASRPALGDALHGLPGGERVTIETCPSDTDHPAKPWPEAAPGTESLKRKEATA
jgi:hypothetical protein